MTNDNDNAGVDFSDDDQGQLSVDLTDVEETTFEALPKGQYACTIADCTFSYSQSSGNPMWTLQLEVSEGEYAGRRLFSHMVFAGNGLGFTKRNMTRIAPELCQGPFDPQDDEVMQSLIGRDIRANVTIRKYQGNDTNNVRDLLAYGEGGGDGFID